MIKNLDDVKKIRMPLFSWDYEDIDSASHWFLMSQAYFECSIFLLEEMVKETFDRNYHRALVIVAIFDHSIELFLKAAIVQTGKEITPNHDLFQLYNQYKKLYPGKKFNFEADILSIVDHNQNIPHNQFARYPTNPTGIPWAGNWTIDVAIWYDRLTVFQKDFNRLIPLMKLRYPNTNLQP